MPLFNSQRDINLFNKINLLLIDNIIDTPIKYLKLDALKMNSNVYGLSTKKIYKQPVKITAMINNQLPVANMLDIGLINKLRLITVSFNMAMLQKANIFPLISDIIQYNDNDYIIYDVINNRYIGGQTNQKFALVCKCKLTTINNTLTGKPSMKVKETEIYE